MLISLTGRQPLLRTEMRITDAGQEPVVIDARHLKFAGPLELAATAALTHVYAASNAPISLRLPDCDAVTSYLQRMNVLEYVSSDTKIIGPTPLDTRTDCSKKLLEVTPVYPATQMALIAQLRIITQANFRTPLGDRVLKAIAELIENAVTHGFSDVGAFASAQVYTGRTTRVPRMEFAIVDTGIGVLEHLRQSRQTDHFRIATCADGLRGALMRGPTTTGTCEVRGHGLADLFARTGELGPTQVVLRSGNGLARVTRRGTASRTLRRTTECSVTGTWAWARVPFPR